MKKVFFLLLIGVVLYACRGNKNEHTETHSTDSTSLANVSVEMKSAPLVSDTPTVLSYYFMQDGKEANLEVFHEKKLHVILVSEDLSWFEHVHPDSTSNNPYQVNVQFPFMGNYFIYADYKPKGGEVQNYKQAVMVHGTKQREAEGIEYQKFVDHQDGYALTLVNASELKYQHSQPLKFSLLKKNKQLKKGVLQSYLGASAHIVTIDKETKDFLHVHSMGNNQYPIYAETFFPKSGWYKLWVQYKVEGKLRTSTFVVNLTKKGETPQVVDHSAH